MGRRRFRPDIEGLRAVAVVAVVLYHAHLSQVSGGFAGVDVFFVVSGYLITSLLWTEISRTGRISMAGFYGRRARRLLPAAMLVIVVTALAARVLLPPLEVPAAMKDGLASALYIGNYRFAAGQTNYLNSSAPPSAFQHFWSLGVEEQFYLLWPLLLVVAAVLWRKQRAHSRPRSPSRAAAMATLGALTLASFVAEVWLTSANQPWAFFSLPTRAWELGVGALLALAGPEIRRLRPEPAALMGWAGLAGVVAAMFAIGPRTPFPGWAALGPVAATGAVLAAGQALQEDGLGRLGRRTGPSLVLGLRPVQFVGRISYSWYLWHWPFLILVPYIVGHRLDLAQNLAVAELSGVAAFLSFYFVENPARSWGWLAQLPRRSLLSGGTLSASGAAACLILNLTVPSLAGHGTAPIAALRANTANTNPISTVDPSPTTVDPLQAQIQALDSQLAGQLSASVATRDVPSNLTPSLRGASSDEPAVFVDGCLDGYQAEDVENCSFGDTTSTTKVLLFGDSHATMWFPAIDYAANQNGWNLIVSTKATCPPILLPIISPVLGRNFTECENWRQAVLARIQQAHPALVILGVARHYTGIYGFTPYSPQWLQGMSQMITTIEATGSRVLVIGPVPKPPVVEPDCLSTHLYDVTGCTVPTGQGINQSGKASEEAAVREAGGGYLDVQPWFCTPQTCAVIVGNIQVWRDDNHITGTYSSFLGPVMSAELKAALSG